MKTKHTFYSRPTVTFEGAHLFEVTARVDGKLHQAAVIAANDERQARRRFLTIQTTRKPRDQLTIISCQLPDPKCVAVSPSQVQALADRTADSYSCDRYASWKACAAALLRRGYTDRQAEEILRSKFTRWAADQSDAADGRATAADLLRFMDRCQGETRALLDEVGLS